MVFSESILWRLSWARRETSVTLGKKTLKSHWYLRYLCRKALYLPLWASDRLRKDLLHTQGHAGLPFPFSKYSTEESKISIKIAECCTLNAVKRCTQTFDSVLALLSRPALILSTFSLSLYESASSTNDKGKNLLAGFREAPKEIHTTWNAKILIWFGKTVFDKRQEPNEKWVRLTMPRMEMDCKMRTKRKTCTLLAGVTSIEATLLAG